MKKYILTGVLGIILVLLGICFFYKEYIIAGVRQGISGEVAQVECYDKSNYFVITKYETESVGSDVLIKYKRNPEQTFPCLYVVEKGDFEIKNEGADYYNALVDHYIIMDSGTGPGIRGIFIYDLDTRAKVYEASKVGAISAINNNVITYYEPLDEEPTLQNCPKLDEYYNSVGNAVIAAETTITFGDIIKKETVGEKQCKGIN